ncbi:hypothetical protein FRC08_016190 [Ceratobasidium sp. 394]|nr:hypothetical protein FRC08_016190 [Ceratobasidium sp. 394]
MFSPRKPAYKYDRPPSARPSPIFSSAVPGGPFTPSSASVRNLQFQSGASTSPFASQPSSPSKSHPVRDLFGDAAFANYRAGLGFPPDRSPFASAPTPDEKPAPVSPLRAGRVPPAFDLPPAQMAKMRATRYRSSPRVSQLFRNVGRSASWLSREERKQSRLRGDSVLGQKRREERRRKALEDEYKKRVEEERARKLAEEMQKRAEEEKRKQAESSPWAAYVARWEHIMSLPADLPEHEHLTARHLPCPLVFPDGASDLSVLTRERVEAFLMDPAHSEGKSRRERVRAALLVWHPDKSKKWICKFREDRRPQIREAVEIIARHLTDMMTA